MSTATKKPGVQEHITLPQEVGEQLRAVLRLKALIPTQKKNLAKRNDQYRKALDQQKLAKIAKKEADDLVKMYEYENQTLRDHQENLAELMPAVRAAIPDPDVGVKVYGFCPGVGTISKNTYSATRFAIED